jgi:Xaa-Pro aminopeptidase
MKKTAIEIGYIRDACAITDECFTYILSQIRPGITEGEIAQKIETFFLQKNAELAFPVIAAFGQNTSLVHYLESKNSTVRCRDNEIILLDFGAKIHGYCSDMTRMIFVGQPKDEWKEAYAAVCLAQHVAIAALDDQAIAAQHLHIPLQYSGASLDQLARHVIQIRKFPVYPHSLGHNIGRKIHEKPKLTIKKDAWIIPGMVFTIEPGVYIENKYGIRIEDTVCLNSDGLEILTKSTKELIII